ncbi:helix-turn-helix domain-containing protein [Herbiconiux sp. P15]|uniref:helix-turn-helix domain-containing protein n=1 Tax=Herbiconiux liukaitaii TaxID=3342799 RepID=UPI0035B79A6E
MKSELGPGLRAVREKKRLSLRAVAAAVGISPSLLSQVETGKTHPSVSTLYAIVTYLGISIDEVMGNVIPPEDPVTRRGADFPRAHPGASAIQRVEDNPTIEMENGVTWQRLAVGGYSIVDPLITTYAPGGSSSIEGRLMRHSGIEYGFILYGELTLKLDFDTYILRPGDSLCFDSLRPHIYINHTDQETQGMWFVLGRHDSGDGSDLLAEHGMALAGERPRKSAVDVLSALRELPPGSGQPDRGAVG